MLTYIVWAGLIAGTLLMTALSFFTNQRYRTEIDVALAKAGKVGGEVLKIPERRLSYDKAYLDRVKTVLANETTNQGVTALALYVRPTLLWNDILFAASLGAFTTLFWLFIYSISEAYPRWQMFCSFFALMGLLYGLADIAEDAWLARLLMRRQPISSSDALLARSFTQMKLLTIVLSLTGGAIFAILSAISRHLAATRLK